MHVSLLHRWPCRPPKQKHPSSHPKTGSRRGCGDSSPPTLPSISRSLSTGGGASLPATCLAYGLPYVGTLPGGVYVCVCVCVCVCVYAQSTESAFRLASGFGVQCHRTAHCCLVPTTGPLKRPCGRSSHSKVGCLLPQPRPMDTLDGRSCGTESSGGFTGLTPIALPVYTAPEPALQPRQAEHGQGTQLSRH